MSGKNTNPATSALAEAVRASLNHQPGSVAVPGQRGDVATTAATVSKLIAPPLMRDPMQETSQGLSSAIGSNASMISQSTASRIRTNRNVVELFPDINLVGMILISSIMSPKDMLSQEITYRSEEARIPGSVLTQMCDVLKTEINANYKLQELFPSMLRSAIQESGSYITLLLPESALDEVINGKRQATTENIFTNDIFQADDVSGYRMMDLGILGDPSTSHATVGSGVFSAETISRTLGGRTSKSSIIFADESVSNGQQLDPSINEMLAVTDNFLSLKFPLALRKAAEEKIASLLPSAASQAFANLDTMIKRSAETAANLDISTGKIFYEGNEKTTPTAEEVRSLVFKSNQPTMKPFIDFPSSLNLKRDSVGRPLTMRVPSEAVIPVHRPGNPEDHVGYFFVCDAENNFVDVDSDVYQIGNQTLEQLLSAREGGSRTLSSLLTEKAKSNLYGDEKVPTLQQKMDIYSSIVVRDLLERFRRGIYGPSVEIANVNEIFQVMLIRQLKSQFTRLVFVPAEYVNYFAFKYHRNGVGRSYLDDISEICSLRAVVMYCKIYALMRSSINITKVDVTLDPRDPDPYKRVATVKELVSAPRTGTFPHAMMNRANITDWIQNAGVMIQFKGHPAVPETSMEFDNIQIPHNVPNDELDSMFRDLTYNHFGLTREAVDTATKTGFATTLEKSDILFSQRIRVMSDAAASKGSDFVRKAAKYDKVLFSKLLDIVLKNIEVIVGNFSDADKSGIQQADKQKLAVFIVESFINQIKICLPQPDTTKLDNLKRSFDAKVACVDDALKYYFEENAMPEEFIGTAVGSVAKLKEVLKSAIMRQWMAENNYVPEFFNYLARNEDGTSVIDFVDETVGIYESVMKLLEDMLKKSAPLKAAMNKTLEEFDTSGADNAGGSSDGYGTDDGSSSGSDDSGFPSFDDVPTDSEDEPASEGGSTEEPPSEGGEDDTIQTPAGANSSGSDDLAKAADQFKS